MTTFTAALDPKQVAALRLLLELRGWEFSEKDYCLFAAAKPADRVNVAVYQKGPKVVVQGQGTADFVRFMLEPDILGVAELDYPAEATAVAGGSGKPSQPLFDGPARPTQRPGVLKLPAAQRESHIGVDESGKGDVLGPLVIAAVHTEGEVAEQLARAGVADSKSIGSDAKIRQLAGVIRRSGAESEVIVISPERYNQLHPKFGANLNRLLAWGHARAIATLAQRVPDCTRSLSDQFTQAPLIRLALAKFPEAAHIQATQRTKAESDVTVAAASVLAREAFIDWMDRASRESGVTLPRGASGAVVKALGRLVERHGAESLPRWAKMHFRTLNPWRG